MPVGLMNKLAGYLRKSGGAMTGPLILSGDPSEALGAATKQYADAAAAAAKLALFIVAVSDEVTALTTGTAKVSFRMPRAMTLSAIRGTLTTAATGATLFQFNVKEAGTTVFSTQPTFDASELTTTTAATPSVLSDTALADDALITIDIVAVGNTIAGAGLKVAFIGTWV